MSPNMFSVTRTSNCSASVASCIAALSTSMCSTRTSGILGRDRVDDPPPEARRLEHVRLVDRRQVAAPRLREPERAPDDALDLRRRVLARVERGAVLANAARAEVEAADELAHDQHVDAVGDAPAAGSRTCRARRAARAGPAPAARRRRRTPGRPPGPSARRRRRDRHRASRREAASRSRGSPRHRSAARRARRRARAARARGAPRRRPRARCRRPAAGRCGRRYSANASSPNVRG